MRTIKFRAKTTANGHWVYGNLMNRGGNCLTIHNSKSEPWVDPETVGQFTGLHDKNGREIYEGDILEERCGEKFEVCWYDDLASYMVELIDGVKPFRLNDLNPEKNCKIVGNVHDNPELIQDKI